MDDIQRIHEEFDLTESTLLNLRFESGLASIVLTMQHYWDQRVVELTLRQCRRIHFDNPADYLFSPHRMTNPVLTVVSWGDARTGSGFQELTRDMSESEYAFYLEFSGAGGLPCIACVCSGVTCTAI